PLLPLGAFYPLYETLHLQKFFAYYSPLIYVISGQNQPYFLPTASFPTLTMDFSLHDSVTTVLLDESNSKSLPSSLIAQWSYLPVYFLPTQALSLNLNR